MFARLPRLTLALVCLLPAAAAAQPPAAEIALPPGPLRRAAECMARDDEAGAAAHLAGYVADHPDELAIRSYLAELLLRLRRPAEARHHFERYVGLAQEQGGEAAKHLLHCHTKLMEIAQSASDDYGEHLNRGIGLLILSKRLAELGEAASAERLLCKAGGELMLARRRRPGEARPDWYLYDVWSRLGQWGPAGVCLRRARANAALSELT